MALTDKSRPLERLAERLPEAVLALRTDGRIVDANAAAGALLGRTPADLRQSRLTDFIHGDDARLTAYLRLCAGTLEMLPGTLRLATDPDRSGFRCEGALLQRAGDGSPALVLLRLKPRAQAISRFRLLTERIEELGRQVELRMRAEAVLDNQRAVLELIAHDRPLEEIMDALAKLIDRQSPAGARSSILLYDVDENTLNHAAAPDLPEEYCRAIDGIKIGPSVGSCGTAAFHNRMVSVSDISRDPLWEGFRELAEAAGLRACFSTPITGTDDAVLGTFAIYYPIARDADPEDLRTVALLARTAALAIERHKAAEEIRALIRRERAARTDAEEANRSKDEFLAMVSHELRNPLNAILGWAKVLAMGAADEETLSSGLGAIERNASLQSQLIGEILDYSRITAGKLRLEIAPADAAALLRTTVESAGPDADARGLELQLDVERLPDVSIALDAGRVQQVINNLLSNAIKFTPRGGQIRVSAWVSQAHLHISVEDTGCGIDPKFLPHVFERFRQQERTQQTEHEGLGLGLAIVRHIVELHHGSITASSEGRGKGARFEVRLPRRFAWSHAKTRQDKETPDLSSLRVLCVDDAADTRTLLSTLLSRAGAEVNVAASGAEALERIGEQRPDVLLCDIGMPGIDGYEVVRRVRALEDTGAGATRIAAIALTAYARGRDRRRALHAGFDAHMAKPIDPVQLVHVVAEFANRREQPDTNKPAV